MAAKAKRQKLATGARDRILASARQLFALHGFEGTSTKDIAAHAGVPSGLVFYYFETKDALIEATFENNPPLEVVAVMREAARQNSDAPIEAGLRAAYQGILEHRYQAYIFIAEIGASRPVEKRLRQLRKDAIAAFAGFLREHSGGATTSVQPETLAQIVSASLMAAVLLDQPRDPDAYIKELTSVVLASLRTTGGTS
ncbi:MAG: TetR/AcrR family transcriptional regulator [Candidatus Eremiobacteraeota bacterium]|nr:TetR/AcrR family transcriptional regulator [Candidatus Eremiobacteraeota bacterium]